MALLEITLSTKNANRMLILETRYVYHIQTDNPGVTIQTIENYAAQFDWAVTVRTVPVIVDAETAVDHFRRRIEADRDLITGGVL